MVVPLCCSDAAPPNCRRRPVSFLSQQSKRQAQLIDLEQYIIPIVELTNTNHANRSSTRRTSEIKTLGPKRPAMTPADVDTAA